MLQAHELGLEPSNQAQPQMASIFVKPKFEGQYFRSSLSRQKQIHVLSISYSTFYFFCVLVYPFSILGEDFQKFEREELGSLFLELGFCRCLPIFVFFFNQIFLFFLSVCTYSCSLSPYHMCVFSILRKGDWCSEFFSLLNFCSKKSATVSLLIFGIWNWKLYFVLEEDEGHGGVFL